MPAIRTTQGNAAIACTKAAPRRPTRIGCQPNSWSRPALPKAPSQAVAWKGERDEGGQDDQAQEQPAAQRVGTKEEEREQDAQGEVRSPRSRATSVGLERQVSRSRQFPDSRRSSDQSAASSEVPDPGCASSRRRVPATPPGRSRAPASPRPLPGRWQRRLRQRLRIRLNRAIPRPA